jgi:hypothetical protein
MGVTWVLEKNVFSEKCFDQMIAHMNARAIPHHVVTIIPFIHQIDGPVPEINGPCVVYGSLGAQKLAQAQDWRPGVFGDPDAFSEHTAASKLGSLYLNANMRKMSIKAVDSYLAARPQVLEFFIKPDRDTKEFAGTVLTAEEFHPWYERLITSGYLDDHDFDVVLSKPQKIGCEWRVVVVDGAISSASLYMQYRQVMPEQHILPEVADAVQQAHALYVPARVYVVDIAQVFKTDAATGLQDGYEFKVIEYNTFNSAGLYECDVAKIIDDIGSALT